MNNYLLQVIDDLNAIVMRDGEPLEASITEGMSHPNIVNTIAHTVTHNSQKRCVSHRCCTLYQKNVADGRVQRIVCTVCGFVK